MTPHIIDNSLLLMIATEADCAEAMAETASAEAARLAEILDDTSFAASRTVYRALRRQALVLHQIAKDPPPLMEGDRIIARILGDSVVIVCRDRYHPADLDRLKTATLRALLLEDADHRQQAGQYKLGQRLVYEVGWDARSWWMVGAPRTEPVSTDQRIYASLPWAQDRR